MNSILPENWKDEHMISCLVRNSIIADGKVDQEEQDAMVKLGEKYASKGINVPDVWDEVDDFMVDLASKDSDKYFNVMQAARDYIAENFDNDRKNVLMTGMMNIVAQDDIVKYEEFLYLKWCMDSWFNYEVEEFINDFTKAGIEVEMPDITKMEDPKDWTIIHDVGVFYTYFSNLAEGGIKYPEKEFINLTLQKWHFKIDDTDYGFDYGNPEDIGETWDFIFEEMYNKSDPNPPMNRVNASHNNLIEYYKNKNIKIENIGTLLHTLFHLSIYDGTISEGQAHQLTHYCKQWSQSCPKAETVIDLLEMVLQGQQLRKELITSGAPPEMFPPVKIDLETGKMEFNPEIFPDGNPLDK